MDSNMTKDPGGTTPTSTEAGDQFLAELDVATRPQAPSNSPAPVLKNGLRYSHQAMIDVLIAQPWIRQNDLARMFGRSPSWISTIMSSDAFQSAFAARKDEVVDPELKLSIEEHTRGLFMRSLEILKEKLNAPPASVSDQLALQTFTQSARALGYGARPEPQIVNNITNHIESQADNLVQLLRREKLKIAQEPIDGEVTSGGQSTHLLSREAHRGSTEGRETSPDQQPQLSGSASG